MKYELLMESKHFDVNRIDDLDYQILGGAGIDKVSELYPSLSREVIEQRFEFIARFMWYSDDEWGEVKD